METTVEIHGMHCASCAAGIETFLESQEGVVDASVDYGENMARLELEGGTDLGGVLEQLEDMGYEVERQ